MWGQLREQDPAHIGPYRLYGRIGAGSMGQVYLGLGPHGTWAAVKVVHPWLVADPEFRHRFRSEIKTVRRIDTPGAVAVLDADPAGDTPWLATRYIAGLGLDRAVRELGALPPLSVRGLVAGLAGTLAAVHGIGVVHRDVKPTNVLISTDGPRLIDFGIAYAVGSTGVTATSGIVGTPAFLSPEQARGERPGPASDVFSLGAVAVYATTGTGPFGDGDAFAVLHRVAEEEPRLAGLEVLASPVRDLVIRCLARPPGARPTAGEVRASLGPGAAPGPGWLPGTLDALVPPLPTVIDHSAPTVTGLAPAPRRRLGRRALVTGVLGAVAAGGVAIAIGSRDAGPADPAPTGPRIRWTHERDEPGGSDSLLSTAGAVLAGHNGTVLALDPTNGTVLWKRVLVQVAPPRSAPVQLAVDGAVVVATTRGTVSRLAPADGAVRWSVRLEEPSGPILSDAPVTVGGGAVLVSQGDRVSARDPDSGAVRWEHRVPAIDAGRHVVAPAAGLALVTFGEGVDALDLASGRLIWRWTTGSSSSSELALDGETAVLATQNGAVTALSAATGQVRWSTPPGPRGTDARDPFPVVGGAAVVVGMDGLAHALDLTTGSERWAGPDPDAGGSASTLATGAGLVYAGSENGLVYGLDPARGAVRWSLMTGGVETVAALGDDGVVAGTDDGRILAIGVT